jgi:hypothetical protein
MGRTVPSFRIVLEEEKGEWKSFRNALNKKEERKEFDDMWDIPRSYLPACSNAVSLVPFHPIAISILFHHYKELIEISKLIEEKEQASSMSKEGGEEEEQRQEYIESTSTLDRYFLLTNNNKSSSK